MVIVYLDTQKMLSCIWIHKVEGIVVRKDLLSDELGEFKVLDGEREVHGLLVLPEPRQDPAAGLRLVRLLRTGLPRL